MEEPAVDAFEVLENVDVRIGKCTVEELMDILIPCMRNFYLRYRKEPNIDCMENYTLMRNCVRQEVKNCFHGINIDKETVENVSQSIVNESLPDEDAYKFCDRSGIEAPVNPDDNSTLYCSKDFYLASEQMTDEFNQLYFKDRGSPYLCQSYESFGINFLRLVKEKCKPSFYRFVEKQMRYSKSRELNPFCSEEQIKSGK